MTATLIDRNRSARPDPCDGSRRRGASGAVGTPMARTPGNVNDKR